MPHMSGSQVAEPGERVTGLADSGNLRWVAVELAWPLEEARRRLDLSPLAAVALGRALSAAALVQRILLKVPSRVTLEARGDGPLGSVLGEVETSGALRGCVANPRLETPDDGGLGLADALGRGTLRVTREERGRSYSGEVELVTGELGSDVAHYLEQSEQIRSAVLLGVLAKPTGIAAAGGVVVEALPGTPDEVIEAVEQKIRQLEGVSASLQRGGLSLLVESVLGDLEPEEMERQSLRYRCRCSREELLDRLRPLAAEDLEVVLGDDGQCEVVCGYCGSRHLYSAAEIGVAH